MTIRDGQVSREEQEKLVAEITTLIERKGLGVELVRTKASDLAAGCSSCTVCPCMICW